MIQDVYDLEFKCVWCGNWFIPNKTKHADFCSDKCFLKANESAMREYEKEKEVLK